MEWVCVALIVGSMVYSGAIVVDYTNFVIEIRPQINKVESKAVEWTNSSHLEEEGRDRFRQDIEATRPVLSDLQLAVDEAKLRRQAALVKIKRLEMALVKSSIRSRRKERKNTV